MNESIKKILGASFVGIIAGVFNALISFFSLPILIALYGKPEYGLIGIALSCNSFLQILSMGIPTGAVKYFSEWLSENNIKKLIRGLQSNLLFFTSVGFVNSCILVFFAINTERYFNVSDHTTLKSFLIIISVSSFINWYFISLQHLLAAYEKMIWTNLFICLSNLVNVLALCLAYYLKISISSYFLIYMCSTIVVHICNLVLCMKIPIFKLKYFVPVYRKEEFNKIMSYSIGLFAIGILQYLANQSQPLILATVGQSGDTLVADYKIIQNVTMIISLMAGVFLQNFIPYMTKTNHMGDKVAVQNFVISSTKWLSIYVYFVCALVIFNSYDILNIYVGSNGQGLYIWLSIWMIGIMFQNNQGISSVVLASGKFKPLMLSLFFASAFSISFSFLFIHKLGLGVVPIGFLIYKFIEAISIYGYYVPKVIGIPLLTLLRSSILKPFLLAFTSVVICTFLIKLFDFSSLTNLLMISCSSFILYICAILRFNLSVSEDLALKTLLKRFNRNDN